MNKRFLLLIGILLLATLLAIFDTVGDAYFLYERIFWYDLVAHGLGGFLVALSYLWAVQYVLPARGRTFLYAFLPLALFVGIVGVMWEVFEVLIKVTADLSFAEWALDTVKDLMMDLMGAVVMFISARRVFTHE